jgi:Glycerol-3-phosphate acyltransferase N-terminal
MLDFYNNYKTAVVGSGVPGADEGLVASVMGAIADRCSMPPAAHGTASP